MDLNRTKFTKPCAQLGAFHLGTKLVRNQLLRRFQSQIEASMRKLLTYAVALHFSLGAAIAQSAATPGNQSLSLDQQEKISQIIADQTPQPLTNVAFEVARDVIVPANIPLQPLPPEAEMISVHLYGYSYLAVEELVAIVETKSRKIITVMQRMRRQ
jgi:hypothetical protein